MKQTYSESGIPHYAGRLTPRQIDQVYWVLNWPIFRPLWLVIAALAAAWFVVQVEAGEYEEFP